MKTRTHTHTLISATQAHALTAAGRSYLSLHYTHTVLTAQAPANICAQALCMKANTYIRYEDMILDSI